MNVRYLNYLFCLYAVCRPVNLIKACGYYMKGERDFFPFENKLTNKFEKIAIEVPMLRHGSL